MPNPVVHFEVLGNDAAKLQSFYADLFQWNVNADNPMNYGLIESQGAGIGGGISKNEQGGGPAVTVYIEVADLQASLDKAVSLGGKVVMPVTDIPDMVVMAQFADPEGNVIGMVKSDH